MFPKIAKPVASDLYPFVQSSWGNRIGLLRWRRGLGTTGTGNLACNVINNTVNTTVQQCIHNSMIITCLAILNNQYNSIQFNSMHIVLPWRKHAIHVILPWMKHSIHYVYFIKYLFVVLWHRRKAHHSQPSLSRTHFISILLTLLSGFSNVWDLPVSWSEITGITTELRNAPSTAADLIFHTLQCLFISVLFF